MAAIDCLPRRNGSTRASAGTVTSRYYGHTLELLGSYEQCIMNADFMAHPCGTLLPNDLGLFDMLGNVMEWCHSRNLVHPKRMDERTVITDTISTEVVSIDDRDLRGGSWQRGSRSHAFAHAKLVWPR